LKLGRKAPVGATGQRLGRWSGGKRQPAARSTVLKWTRITPRKNRNTIASAISNAAPQEVNRPTVSAHVVWCRNVKCIFKRVRIVDHCKAMSKTVIRSSGRVPMAKIMSAKFFEMTR
jgi:hypothetical protein